MGCGFQWPDTPSHVHECMLVPDHPYPLHRCGPCGLWYPNIEYHYLELGGERPMATFRTTDIHLCMICNGVWMAEQHGKHRGPEGNWCENLMGTVTVQNALDAVRYLKEEDHVTSSIELPVPPPASAEGESDHSGSQGPLLASTGSSPQVTPSFDSGETGGLYRVWARPDNTGTNPPQP